MTDLPVLTTERLTLRPRSRDDVDAVMAMDADPEVVRFILDGVPPDPVAHRRELTERIDVGHGPLFGYWSVFERAQPDDFLGWVCLTPLPGHDHVEIGWRFCRASWGRGYATEAARELLHYGFDTARLQEIVAVVKPANVMSLRVIDKLGLHADGTCLAYGEELALYRMKRPTCS